MARTNLSSKVLIPEVLSIHQTRNTSDPMSTESGTNPTAASHQSQTRNELDQSLMNTQNDISVHNTSCNDMNSSTGSQKRKASGDGSGIKKKRGRPSNEELLEKAKNNAFYPRKIAFSSFAEFEKTNFAEKVGLLGGEIVEDVSQAEVLVVKYVFMNMKVKTAIVSGVRIVSKEYIVDSAVQSKWLNANLYELGASMCPKAIANPMLDGRFGESKTIVHSAYRWRLRIESTEKKPFHNWNVVFFMDPNNVPNYVSIIKAGGGKASCSTNHAGDYHNVTHAGLQHRNTMVYVHKDTLIELGKSNVPFYDEKLISNYLLGMFPKKEMPRHKFHDEYHRRYPLRIFGGISS